MRILLLPDPSEVKDSVLVEIGRMLEPCQHGVFVDPKSGKHYKARKPNLHGKIRAYCKVGFGSRLEPVKPLTHSLEISL